MEMKGWNGERVKEFLWLYFKVPVNNFSIMSGRVSRVDSVLSRGYNSDVSSEARTLDLEVSTLPLSHYDIFKTDKIVLEASMTIGAV